MGKTKIETYIGFCIKSGRLTRGAGAVETLKNGVYLIIVAADASDNTKKLAVKYKNRLLCPLIVCKSGFDSVVNKPGCKMAAVRDKQLAKAILDNLDDNFEFYAGGNY